MTRSLLHLISNVRAALLLLVVVCAAPTRAEARCGHQSTIFKAPLVAPADGPPAAEPESKPAPVAPAPCPCNGPNCSDRQDRDAPPPTTGPTAPRAVEATLCAAALAAPDPRAGFARDRSAPRPVDQASSIFHPPRSR